MELDSGETPDEPEAYVAGIDEAGRGPVLGPMLYGIFFIPKSLDDARFLQKRFHVADSKVLSAKRRSVIFRRVHQTEEVRENYLLKSISAATMCQNMLRRTKYNLNAMSHDAASDLVGEAKTVIESRGGQLTTVFVDTVGRPAFYRRRLERDHPEITFIVESKADAKYATVSAAAIMAKVTRDLEIERIAGTSKIPIGSGYPSDQRSRDYLDATFDPVFGFMGNFVRFSWETVQLMFDDQGVYVEWSDEDEEVEKVAEDPSSRRRKPKKKGRKRTGKKRRRKERSFARQSKRKRRRLSRPMFFRETGLANLTQDEGEPFFVMT